VGYYNLPNNPSIASHDKDEGFSKTVDITPVLQANQLNALQFNVRNGLDSTSNYTYGMEIRNNGSLVFRHRDGAKENLDAYPAGAHVNRSTTETNELLNSVNYSEFPISSIMTSIGTNGVPIGTNGDPNKKQNFYFWLLP